MAAPTSDVSPPVTSTSPSPAPAALRWLRLLASAASGVAVAVSFPPYDVVWLLPFGLAGLMLTIRGRTGWGGFGHGLVFGLGFMLPLMRWVTVIGPDAWVALGLLEALFYGLMGTTWAWLRPKQIWPVAFALTWVGAELLRGVVPWGGMPWGRLAFGLVETPLDRFGRLGGTALVAFVVVLAVALLVHAGEAIVMSRDVRMPALVTVVSALALGLVSFLLPIGIAGQVGHAQVAAVQGNVPGEGMDAFAERRAVLNNHAQATTDFAAQVAAGQRPAPDFVIWPENSTDIDPFQDPTAYAEIDAAVRAIGVPTLVGAVVAGPDADHVQNMGIVWDPVTGPGETYVKRHPVPFGEYIPFRGVLVKFITRLDQIPLDFARGPKPGVLDLAGTTIGDVICFEVAYDGLVRDVVNAGAQLLVVQTNNATYTGTGQLEQQFAISRYRAVETGRAVVVAATNGISGVIEPDGSVLVETQQRTQEVLDESVPLGDGITWGVRFGWWVELLMAVSGLSLAVWAYLGLRRRPGTLAT